LKKIFFVILIALCLGSYTFAASERELFENGVSLLKQNKNQAAVDAFTVLIDMVPRNPDAYKNRGVAHMRLNQYDEAINDFERVTEILPDLKGIYSNLGVAWYYKKDYARSIENYNEEISRSPENHFAYFNRAICKAELEEYEESFKDIIKTLELSPEFYMAVCLKGDLLVNMNQPVKAQLAYEKAILIDPDQAYARNQLEMLILEVRPVVAVQKKSSSVDSVVKHVSPPRKIPLKTDSKKTVKISSSVPTATSENYELQIGAFRVLDNALLLQKKMESNGYRVRVLELTRPSSITWYLVRTGTYARQEEAELSKTILKNDLGIDGIVRPYGRF
jgi:tetratricopeptide (TPR) repeat protein